MDELIEKMKVVLADTVTFYQKTHQFHWNVEGGDFYMFHLLFERIYTEVYGAVDGIGEQIRALGGYAPYGHARISELTNIMDAPANPPDLVMVRSLMTDNEKVLASLLEAYRLADKYNEIGLSNFLQDRFNAHKVHHYMLRSTLKGEEQ
jgi:starvation-inducible DNA-binding protein